MRISTMACHALHLLLCLSEQDDEIPASASELSVCTGISEKFVQKIMKKEILQSFFLKVLIKIKKLKYVSFRKPGCCKN